MTNHFKAKKDSLSVTLTLLCCTVGEECTLSFNSITRVGKNHTKNNILY